MTPEERHLVTELFDRLATLEDAQRDPDAERAIRDGLEQAPNAVYALVQTALVQDEVLKRADARIQELEASSARRQRAAARQVASSTACATASWARRTAAARLGADRCGRAMSSAWRIPARLAVAGRADGRPRR